jgi:hypothetical protein
VRLNDGLPVWHASVSLTTPRSEPMAAPGRLERAAVTLLHGVGGDVEWWLWNRVARVGHLRVAVTDAEYQRIPPGCAVADAGPAGPQRKRTSGSGDRRPV